MIDAENCPEGWRFELMDEQSVHPVTIAPGQHSYPFEAHVTLPLATVRGDWTTTIRGHARTRSDALRELTSRVALSSYRACLLAPGEPSRAELVTAAQEQAKRTLTTMLTERSRTP
jgi:hypothetical protein